MYIEWSIRSWARRYSDCGHYLLYEYLQPQRTAGRRVAGKEGGRKRVDGKRHIKTSLAPGSRVVTEYLTDTGLMPYLEKLGFNLAGYGCTTCIGNSGPLSEPIEEAVVIE